MRVTLRSMRRKPFPRPIIKDMCYLCSKKAVDPTREHIFAKQFFQPDELEKPILLTACKKCNEGKAFDEEYCYLHLITSYSEQGAPRQVEYFNNVVTPKVWKQYQRRPTKGTVLMASFDRQILELGEKIKHKKLQGEPKILVDPERFVSFYERIAKGLFTCVAGQVQDWDSYEILVFDNKNVGKLPEMVLKKGWRDGDFREVWGGSLAAFGGGMSATTRGRIWSYWTITLYDVHSFGVVFLPKAGILSAQRERYKHYGNGTQFNSSEHTKRAPHNK